MRPAPDPTETAGDGAWTHPGQTCWRRGQAHRAALLHDGAAYFAAARGAMLSARRSITLLGWSFDPRTRLLPRGDDATEGENLATFLRGLKAQRPDLAVRLLIWDMPWPISAGNDLTPEAVRVLLGEGIDYRIDSTLPFGACQHQKVLVVDEAVAFCGGSDFEANRWDTTAHRDQDPRRRLPTGESYPPRHDVMMLVDGDAAMALAELARDRWQKATSEIIPPSQDGVSDPWPDCVVPQFHDVTVSVSRTLPGEGDEGAIRECEAFYLTAIRRARRTIYLENQYFTSPLIGDALQVRLAEPNGPEVVVVVSERSPNGFDQLTMDSARRGLIARLRAADVHDRLRILAPHTPKGRPILVHSKVAIFDDRVLRVGSTNLNNRSFGYDTECDLAIEVAADARADRDTIARLRLGLVAHHAGCPRDAFTEALARTGSVVAVLDDPALAPPARLCRVVASRRGLLARLIETWHLGDPTGLHDAWHPWRRLRVLRRARRALEGSARPTPTAPREISGSAR